MKGEIFFSDSDDDEADVLPWQKVIVISLYLIVTDNIDIPQATVQFQIKDMVTELKVALKNKCISRMKKMGLYP